MKNLCLNKNHPFTLFHNPGKKNPITCFHAKNIQGGNVLFSNLSFFKILLALSKKIQLLLLEFRDLKKTHISFSNLQGFVIFCYHSLSLSRYVILVIQNQLFT